MSFADNLQQIAGKIDDVLGVAISGMDGIILEEYKADPLLDLASFAAEYSALLRVVDKTGLSLDLGASEEISILTERTSVLIKKINAEYFLLLAVGSEKNFGKGRFLMKKEAATLVEEL